jgi:hypothetical protein
MTQVVESLSSKLKTLSSIPNNGEGRSKEGREGGREAKREGGKEGERKLGMVAHACHLSCSGAGARGFQV